MLSSWLFLAGCLCFLFLFLPSSLTFFSSRVTEGNSSSVSKSSTTLDRSRLHLSSSAPESASGKTALAGSRSENGHPTEEDGSNFLPSAILASIARTDGTLTPEDEDRRARRVREAARLRNLDAITTKTTMEATTFHNRTCNDAARCGIKEEHSLVRRPASTISKGEIWEWTEWKCHHRRLDPPLSEEMKWGWSLRRKCCCKQGATNQPRDTCC